MGTREQRERMQRRLAGLAVADFDESAHPRDERGRFGSGDGNKTKEFREIVKDAHNQTLDKVVQQLKGAGILSHSIGDTVKIHADGRKIEAKVIAVNLQSSGNHMYRVENKFGSSYTRYHNEINLK